MMGPRQEAQPGLFYECSLEGHVPPDHLLRSIDRFVGLSGIRTCLADFYSHAGRPGLSIQGGMLPERGCTQDHPGGT